MDESDVSWEEFFATSPPLAEADVIKEQLSAFIVRHVIISITNIMSGLPHAACHVHAAIMLPLMMNGDAPTPVTAPIVLLFAPSMTEHHSLAPVSMHPRPSTLHSPHPPFSVPPSLLRRPKSRLPRSLVLPSSPLCTPTFQFQCLHATLVPAAHPSSLTAPSVLLPCHARHRRDPGAAAPIHPPFPLQASQQRGGASLVVCVTSGGTTLPLKRRCVHFIDSFTPPLLSSFLPSPHLPCSKHRSSLGAPHWHFLAQGYSVIFLHRRGSMRPFCRGLPESPLLTCLRATPAADTPRGEGEGSAAQCVQQEGQGEGSGRGEEGVSGEQGGSGEKSASAAQSSGSGSGRMYLEAIPPYTDAVHRAVLMFNQAQEGGRLLLLPFTTLFQYLQLLRLVAEALNPIGPRGMVYLAAAVSDFFVPWPSMVEHKIQSGAGPLDIHLARVPKMIPLLRSLWCPSALLVSFKLGMSSSTLHRKEPHFLSPNPSPFSPPPAGDGQQHSAQQGGQHLTPPAPLSPPQSPPPPCQLETDSSILLSKARSALQKNQVHAVVANELLTRGSKVVLVTEEGEEVIERGGGGVEGKGAVGDVEEPLVKLLAAMHHKHCQRDR
ncbi:unnamed protein product [Closterium sp. Naga37s-1]|nr:unnamed protein product [Closterium sp. Naga37s-1]